MGFRQGAYCKIWSIEDKGKFSVVRLSTSRKNNDGKYETDFQDGFVRVIGEAHEALRGIDVPKGGVSAKIGQCEVTTPYDPKTKKSYTNYAVFGLELSDNGGGKTATKTKAKAKPAPEPEDDTDNDLPF